MDKLKMHSLDGVARNIEAIGKLFPNVLTEVIRGGRTEYAVDFDKLRQELSGEIVEGREERYEFSWPDKKKAKLAANAPITAALRPICTESVGRDGTPGGFDSENLYIEGDNLEVLKLLQENYLGKVKMIYIDPPYNTGNDFVYEDDFSQSAEEYMANSGQYDEEGNRMVTNTESNGRLHTDWLNMIYPRLKVAKNLLKEDGVIFISIDDNELENMKILCNEIFGASNYRNSILVRRRTKSLNSQFAENGLYSMNVGYEYVLVYSKEPKFLMQALQAKKENASSKGRWDVFWSNADRPTMRYELLGFTPKTGQWRNSKEKAEKAVSNYQKFQAEFADKMTIEEYSKKTGIADFIRRIPNGTGKNGGVQHWVAPSDTLLRTSNWTDIEVSQIGKEIDIPFDNPKSKNLLLELIRLSRCNKDDLILDFFSGSATTAHAVMQLNAEDGGRRKFIMVQLPEVCDEKSEAYKAGYKTICDIGEERIRRAGKKIREETGADIDYGFRCLRLDTSNMQDVYYAPEDVGQGDLFAMVDTVKPGRSDEDLLFQILPELNIQLSAKIEVLTIAGKRVFNVNDGELLACFERDAAEETVKGMAQRMPAFAVFRDVSFASDSVAVNFDQIFETYSPNTVRKVL